MLEKFFSTEPNFILTVARVTLGLVMIPHGFQKLFGWLGGYGWSATLGFFSSQGIPVILGILVILAESFGALGLILGLFTKLSAFGIGLTMLGAAIFQRQNGFFMNWFGSQSGEGIEYHILAMGLAFVLLIAGGGAFSLDWLISQKLK
ncbi:DoxX family protein [Leptospira langatensis]|uniref:DoxX family protein n=1 Tax=Leptospira langatensis TaxID=2484983 RepID=A0A5F1ZWX1_9LEPT|nr:DoxX family protein [Leptospira langatensis]TGJ98450.1 DoxX family protein [Leptospira langatensis]TGL43365.1 DoxX family protein [Leptospira langatensis]